MHTHVALLRGINVSGQKLIKMAPLRTSCEALGFKDVKTYLQSGNLVFRCAETSAPGLGAKIARKILADFGHAVVILLRTPDELESVVKGNPLRQLEGLDEDRWYVTFLSEPAPSSAEERLRPLAAKTERFAISGREIYLHCPEGYGNTKFSNNAIEKKLSLPATTRNWRTIKALLALARE